MTSDDPIGFDEVMSGTTTALDSAIATIDQGHNMTDDNVRRVFDGFDPAQYAEEVQDKWGDTDAYEESRRRTSEYTEDDWKKQRAEAEGNIGAFVGLLQSGVSPTDARAIDAAREHGAIIERWFYPLSPEAHVGLAQMYVTDARFEATYERAATGLTRYISEAIDALHSG